MASKTSKTNIKTQERRELVLKLRKGGATYRQIRDEINKKFKAEDLPKTYDEREAYRDVKRELDKLKKEVSETADEIRTMEAERLQSLWMVHYRGAQRGNKSDSDLCLKIHDRIMKLHGLEIQKVSTDNKVEIVVTYDE